MRSLQSTLLAGAAWTLLCAATDARAVATISLYEAYMSVVLAVGGLIFGIIVVLLVMCSSWDAATLRLQPRERRMWELKLPNGLSGDDAKVLEKLHDEADAARKKKKDVATRRHFSTTSSNGHNNTAASPAASSAGCYANQRSDAAAAYADGGASGPNPYTRTEDDVVAFSESLWPNP
jgi:hypothetical protein